jgi:hypothetical protein
MNFIHLASKGKFSGNLITNASWGRFYAFAQLIGSNIIIFVLNITKSILRVVER